MNLEDIKDPGFLKEMDKKQLDELAKEIREFLIDNISQTGGHFSSNLGVVDLTIALHYVFNSPEDKIFFDVGHQSYTHKILTGRAKDFPTLKKLDGLSGFQKRKESIHDVFEAGHSSTALSSAVGMAIARDLNGDNYSVVPVIGDAAMVGGPTLEALNYLGGSKTKVIVILNDNEMSISKNVGGFHNFLSDVRTSVSYNKAKADMKTLFKSIPGGNYLYRFFKFIKDSLKNQVLEPSIFTEFGIEYLGPIDGHDMTDLIRALKKAKDMQNSVVVHVITKKGKGYKYAEEDEKGIWHSVPPFDRETGIFKTVQKENMVSWSEAVSSQVYRNMAFDENIVTITPAMRNGSELENIFRDFPNRAIDVGIAEENATTLASGLSIAGKKPFLSMYSSFMQRAYDQLNHDLARMDLPCLISIDRSGFVGSDGETHHGVFDIGMIMALPNVIFFTPRNAGEAKAFVNTAFINNDHPYFIRLPKADVENSNVLITEHIEIGKWEKVINEKNKKVIITYDMKVDACLKLIRDKELDYDLINARFFKPMDLEMLDESMHQYDEIVIYETDLKNSSLGLYINEYLITNHYQGKVKHIAVGDHYTPQGSISELQCKEHVDILSLYERIK